MFKITHKKIVLFLLVSVIVGGFFLRAYNFADWLHFELDQSRDAMVVDLALEGGPGELPLLGPKAAGTYLRLGPAFYYFQYLGGLVFGQTPQGVAYPTMLFSVAAIGLLYLFLRRIFDRWISLSLAAVSAASMFLVMYGRFAWNPNAIPFFLLATFYALLRAVDANESKKGRWLVLSFAALALATQLHFLVFLSLPVAVAAFLVIRRPKIKLRAWLAAAGVFLFLYIPVILNDFETKGANMQEFFKAITEKSEKGDNHTLADKVLRAYMESARGSLLLISGQEQTEIPSINLSKSADGFIEVKCAEKCKKNVWLGILAIIGYSAGSVLLVWRFFHEKMVERKEALLLTGIWTVLVSGLYVPLAFDLAPRFFLLLVPITFLLLGLILNFLGEILRQKKIVVLLVASLLVILNLVSLQTRFSELSRAVTEMVEPRADRVLKEKTRVTLEQQLEIANWLESFYRENGAIIYLNSEPFYRRAILYHIGRRGIPYEDLRGAKVYRKGNYFTAYVSNSSAQKKTDKYSNSFDVVEKRQFGTLTVFRLAPKENMIVAEEQPIKPQKKKQKAHTPGVPERYTWNEIFN